VQGSLQQWLGTLIQVEDVAADSADATLTVEVRYTVLATQARRVANFTRAVTA
jgi:Bacteriophage baseplate protein W